MDRKFIVATVAIIVLAVTFTPNLLHAQSDTAPEGVSEEAAQALGKDRGKTEEEQLEEILSEQQNEYDLISSGNFKVDYSVNYSFNSNPRSQIISQNDTGFIINDLTRDSQHTLNQTFNLRYGFWNNLTTGISVPVVAKLNTATDESVSAFGDVSLSTRYQPYVVRPGQTKVTLFSNLSIPTGKSSFSIDRDQELSSGSGLYGISGGLNFSKTFDPVVAFGNFGINYNLPKDNIDQRRPGGDILREVKPGPAISWGVGMAYSLSYDVSLTYSLSYSLSFPSEFVVTRGGNTITAESTTATSATFNLSTGWRLSPRYQMTFGLGFGLTEDSPDFNINVGFPLVLETPSLL